MLTQEFGALASRQEFKAFSSWLRNWAKLSSSRTEASWGSPASGCVQSFLLSSPKLSQHWEWKSKRKPPCFKGLAGCRRRMGSVRSCCGHVPPQKPLVSPQLLLKCLQTVPGWPLCINWRWRINATSRTPEIIAQSQQQGSDLFFYEECMLLVQIFQCQQGL